MPTTIRYCIKNEYGLANSDLYKNADKDKSEAILEGVAMAGCTGMLRQLGDLAELAAEVFHNLHEEVMSLSSRGHNLTLRLQQLENDLPCFEQQIVTQSTYQQLNNNQCLEWHPNLQMEQNFVTSGDMPGFVMNSYKECRGPPKLFMLDKFDVSGSGSCLKRFTDPSFIRMQNFSTLLEQTTQKERTRKKKESLWSHGEASQISSMSDENYALQHDTCNRVSDKISLKHINLKLRKLNKSDACNLKNHMGNLFDIQPFEQRLNAQISFCHSMRSNDSSESSNEVNEVIINPLSNTQRSRSPPAKQKIVGAPEEKLKKHIGLLVKQESDILGQHLIYSKTKVKETFFDDVEEVEVYSDEEQPDEMASETSVTHEVDQNGFLADTGSVTEDSFDMYDDEVDSQVDNYADALTTMDAEMEIVMENRTRGGIESDTDEEQHELQAELSPLTSNDSPGFNPLFRRGKSNPSFSDALGDLAATLLNQKGMNTCFSPMLNRALSKISEVPLRGRHTESKSSRNGVTFSGITRSMSKLSSCSDRNTSNVVKQASITNGNIDDIEYTEDLSSEDATKTIEASNELVDVHVDNDDYDEVTFNNIDDCDEVTSEHALANSSIKVPFYPSDCEIESRLEVTEESGIKKLANVANNTSEDDFDDEEGALKNVVNLYRNPIGMSILGNSLESINHSLKTSNHSASNSLDQESLASRHSFSEIGEPHEESFHSFIGEEKDAYDDQVYEEVIAEEENTFALENASCDDHPETLCDDLSGSTPSTGNKISEFEKSEPTLRTHRNQDRNSGFASNKEKLQSPSESLIEEEQLNTTDQEKKVHSPSSTSVENDRFNQEVPNSYAKLPPLPPNNRKNESVITKDISYTPSNFSPSASEDENPMRKLRTALNKQRSSLVEVLASPDKNQLRKVPELARPSAIANTDERGSFLEQIKNKSFSLKPTTIPTMKFKGGPPTNLKVIAILEKANAIRQACVGSDDDEDGDSWSDS